MLRKLALVLSFACLVFVAAMIVSCGSSKTHLGTTCTGGPFTVTGDWQGTLGVNGVNVNIAGVINSQGQAVFFDDSPASDPNSGSVLVLPAITGQTCSFSGSSTIYAAPLALGAILTGSVQGTINSNSSMSATGTFNNSSGNVTLSSFAPITGSVTVLTGAQDGNIQQGPGLGELTFTQSGSGASMSFANSGETPCPVNGTFTQEASANVFDVSITFSGTNQACPPVGTITGLGFESTTDYFGLTGSPQIQGTYLYAASSTSALVVEVSPLPVVHWKAEAPPYSFAAKPSAFIFR
jgi:hypothetical protein